MPQGGWLGFLPVVLTLTIPNPSMYTFKNLEETTRYSAWHPDVDRNKIN